jgi:hypothetical protein
MWRWWLTWVAWAPAQFGRELAVVVLEELTSTVRVSAASRAAGGPRDHLEATDVLIFPSMG